MKNVSAFTLLAFLLLSPSVFGKSPEAATASAAKTPKPKKDKKTMPHVIIDTSLGAIEVELNSERAPETVENFLMYVDKKFYDDLIFHRVIDNFMIQGGGFDKGMKQRPTEAPIKNEAHNNLKNDRGTIAMARTQDPNSASSQFFINLKDNDFLNYKGPLPSDIGYAVFGKVVDNKEAGDNKGTDSMAVVDKIAKVETGTSGQMSDVPTTPVIIKSIRRKEEKK